MKVISDYKSEEVKGERLKSGDVVFMKAEHNSSDFYGMYVYGVGVIELENGSTAYTSCKNQMFVGTRISYWTVEKIFRNCELIIKE